MSKRQFFLMYALPAIGLLIAGFWFGSQSNVIFALAGFLGCFLAAVTLLVEGQKKLKSGKSNQ